MASILDTGAGYRTGALQGMNRSSQMETERDQANLQMKEAEKSQKATTTASGMATGAMIGGMATSWTGPGAVVGAVVGAGVGYLLSEVF